MNIHIQVIHIITPLGITNNLPWAILFNQSHALNVSIGIMSIMTLMVVIYFIITTVQNLPSLIQRLFSHIKPSQQRGPLAEHRDASAKQST